MEKSYKTLEPPEIPLSARIYDDSRFVEKNDFNTKRNVSTNAFSLSANNADKISANINAAEQAENSTLNVESAPKTYTVKKSSDPENSSQNVFTKTAKKWVDLESLRGEQVAPPPPPKRKVGRPRKNPLPPVVEEKPQDLAYDTNLSSYELNKISKGNKVTRAALTTAPLFADLNEVAAQSQELITHKRSHIAQSSVNSQDSSSPTPTDSMALQQSLSQIEKNLKASLQQSQTPYSRKASANSKRPDNSFNTAKANNNVVAERNTSSANSFSNSRAKDTSYHPDATFEAKLKAALLEADAKQKQAEQVQENQPVEPANSSQAPSQPAVDSEQKPDYMSSSTAQAISRVAKKQKKQGKQNKAYDKWLAQPVKTENYVPVDGTLASSLAKEQGISLLQAAAQAIYKDSGPILPQTQRKSQSKEQLLSENFLQNVSHSALPKQGKANDAFGGDVQNKHLSSSNNNDFNAAPQETAKNTQAKHSPLAQKLPPNYSAVGVDVYQDEFICCLDRLNPDGTILQVSNTFKMSNEGIAYFSCWAQDNQVAYVVFCTRGQDEWLKLYNQCQPLMPNIQFESADWINNQKKRLEDKPSFRLAQDCVINKRLDLLAEEGKQPSSTLITPQLNDHVSHVSAVLEKYPVLKAKKLVKDANEPVKATQDSVKTKELVKAKTVSIKHCAIGVDVYQDDMICCLDRLNPDGTIFQISQLFKVTKEGIEEFANWAKTNKVLCVIFCTRGQDEWRKAYDMCQPLLPEMSLEVAEWKAAKNKSLEDKVSFRLAQDCVINKRLSLIPADEKPTSVVEDQNKLKKAVSHLFSERNEFLQLRRSIETLLNRAHFDITALFENHFTSDFANLIIHACEFKDDDLELEDFVYNTFEDKSDIDPYKIYRALHRDLTSNEQKFQELADKYQQYLQLQQKPVEFVDKVVADLSPTFSKHYQNLLTVPGVDPRMALTFLSEIGLNISSRSFLALERMISDPNNNLFNQFLHDGLLSCALKVSEDTLNPLYPLYEFILKKSDPAKALNTISLKIARLMMSIVKNGKTYEQVFTHTGKKK